MQSFLQQYVENEEWERMFEEVVIRKKDMNRLVMDFLIAEGYDEAGEKFRIETGTEIHADPILATVKDRVAVKKAVLSGNIEEAIEKVNDLNPMILNANPLLSFNLQKQRLIELIRNGEDEKALHFAQEELGPKAMDNQSNLEELERVMSLFIYEDKKDCPYGELLDESLRIKIAREVFDAILTIQGYNKGPNIPSLLKRLICTQKQLDEIAFFPRINILKTASVDEPEGLRDLVSG